MKRQKRLLAALIVVIATGALIYRMETGYGCGPFFETAYFTYSLHPDFPLDGYARGQIGIVQPTYAQSYLYVAYRYVSGRRFNAGEQKALLALWQGRLANVSFVLKEAAEKAQKPWPQQWIDARKKVPGAGPDPSIEVFRDFGHNYQQYINCTDDSFKTAITTLDQRIARFGADSTTVKEWLIAQDQVFANCTGKPPGFRLGNENRSLVETIPVALQSGAPPAARADRDYQIAAAYFYAAEFDEAGKRFQEIAQDSGSPWRQIARLLVVRCLLRKATLSTEDDKYDRGPLVQAESKLHQFLDDQSLSELHPSARRLLDFVEFRLHPGETKRRLATHLLQENIESTLKQNLWDYTLLTERALPEEGEEGAKVAIGQPPKGSGTTNEARLGDDLTDWLGTMQNATPAGLDHSIERWKQTQSVPWLVASLSKIHAGQPSIPELLKAADGVAADSPGFATVAFHRLRLMTEENKADEVRTRLDKLISENRKNLPPSSLNLFLALRMKVASNLEDMLRFAQRVPATITYDTEGLELPEDFGAPERGAKEAASKQVRFDADASKILNKILPLDALVQAAESKALPDDLRRQVAQAAWVRSVLLGDGAKAQRITPIWENLEPAVKEDLEVYRAGKSPEAAQFAAIYLMLKFPGTRPIVDSGVARTTTVNKIDNFRDNWWCLPEPGAPKDPSEAAQEPMLLRGPLHVLYPDRELGAPAFLSAEQKTMGQDDWKKLRQVGVAPNYLAKEVLTWGKQHPDDPREAEALYLVVRSTRFGCTDKATGGLSKAAFEFLHAQYPKTEWARKTRYWYGDGSRN